MINKFAPSERVAACGGDNHTPPPGADTKFHVMQGIIITALENIKIIYYG
jgi:hypothetical protein